MVHGIIIFGASGSGTTTLGREIAGLLDFTHLDADDFFWEDTVIPYNVKRPREERIKKLMDAIKECRGFVLSGSICGWDEPFLPLFDLAIYVATATDIRIERLKAREYSHFGDRICEGGDMYDNHRNFIEWAKTYDTAGIDQRSHALHMEWAKLLRCPMIRVNGTADFKATATEITLRYYTKPSESWRVEVKLLGELSPLRFVVIFARHKGKWVYSRHKQRKTWETAGGHIEPGETPYKAAKRELYEETGITDCALVATFDYAVHTNTEFSYGRVFLAEVETIGRLPDSEMAEAKLFDSIPESMTYPQILPVLYMQIQAQLAGQCSPDEI